MIIRGGGNMDCYFRLVMMIFFGSLLGVPVFFYGYERMLKRPARWCFHKTIMLFGALTICLGLTWPLIMRSSIMICNVLK